MAVQAPSVVESGFARMVGRLKLALAAAGAASALFVLYRFNPATSNLYGPCPFHVLTGLYCPGCGSLRALHQLLHGHLAAALGLNPLLVLLLPFLGYSLASYVALQRTGRPLPGARIGAFWTWALLAVIIAFWALRNVPIYPFSALAP